MGSASYLAIAQHVAARLSNLAEYLGKFSLLEFVEEPRFLTDCKIADERTIELPCLEKVHFLYILPNVALKALCIAFNVSTDIG